MNQWGSPARPVTRVRQADPGLDALLAALNDERAAMKQALGTHPPDGKQQMDVRRGLLASLEAYAGGLSTRGLPVPPRLRDELSLQRQLASCPDRARAQSSRLERPSRSTGAR